MNECLQIAEFKFPKQLGGGKRVRCLRLGIAGHDITRRIVMRVDARKAGSQDSSAGRLAMLRPDGSSRQDLAHGKRWGSLTHVLTCIARLIVCGSRRE